MIEYMKEASKEEVACKKVVEVLSKRMDNFENELKLIRSEVKNSILKVKTSIIQWMVGLLIRQIAVIFSILKLTGVI